MKSITYLSLCFIIGCVSTTASNEKPSFDGYEKYYLKTRNDSWVITSPLPMDKSYIELNENQQKLVKNYYSDLGKNDRPPFPVNGTQSLYKAFIQAQHKPPTHVPRTRFGLGPGIRASYTIDRGNLVAIAIINESGKTEKVEILKSPTRKLGQATTKILLNTKFDTGTCNEKPCQRKYFFQLHSGGHAQWREEKYTVYPPEKHH